MDIQLTANAGVVVTFRDGTRVLADALHQKKTRFSVVPHETAERVIASAEPVTLMLVTHDHADHYDESLARRFLEAHPETIFAGPIEVPGIDPVWRQIRLDGIGGRANVGPLDLSWVRLVHEGKEYADVANYGCAVRSGEESFLVLGDAAMDAVRDGIELLTEAGPVDAALVNFPVIALGRGRAALEGAAARNIIGFHLPFAADDTERYRQSAQHAVPRAQERSGLPVHLLLEEGQHIQL